MSPGQSSICRQDSGSVRGSRTRRLHWPPEPRSFGVCGPVQGFPTEGCEHLAPHAPNKNPRRCWFGALWRTQQRSSSERINVRNVRHSTFARSVLALDGAGA